MSHTYEVEYTDTYCGEANYSWVVRKEISVPEWTAFKDFDGNGRIEPKGYQQTLMRKAKAAVGITGMRGKTYRHGDMYEFRPYRSSTVMFVVYKDC